MYASIALNAAIVIINAACLVWGLRKAKPPTSIFRYFTMLSNLLCAAAGAVLIVLWFACGSLPLWSVVFKYAGVCAVTVTMLTVLLFLGPASHDWKGLLSGADLFLHIVCPVLALVSFLCFETAAMPAWTIAVGVSPVVLYAVLYCYKVVYAREDRRWPDFYGFNAGGKWPLSYAAMIAASGLIALILWAVRF